MKVPTYLLVRGVAAGAALACATLLIPLIHARGATPAALASTASALEMAERAMTTVAGPDDEGSYRLIDPIGPGGISSTGAADEVFATTLVGGKYTPWDSYSDPFSVGPKATPPAPPGGYRQNRLVQPVPGGLR